MMMLVPALNIGVIKVSIKVDVVARSNRTLDCLLSFKADTVLEQINYILASYSDASYIV